MNPVLADRIAVRNAELDAHTGIDFTHYGPVLQDRADRYAAHVACMTITPDVALWERAMTSAYGVHPRMHWYVCDNWITALLIARYGEEPDAALSTDPNFMGWPTTLTEGDLRVADRWLRGDWRGHAAFISITPEG